MCFAPAAAAFDPLTAPLEEVEEWEAPEPSAVDHAPVPAVSESAAIEAPYEAPPLAPRAAPTATSEDGGGATAQLADVDIMLSMLAAEHRESDPTVALADRMGDRGVRMMVMFGGMAVVAVLAFVGLTALGSIF